MRIPYGEVGQQNSTLFLFSKWRGPGAGKWSSVIHVIFCFNEFIVLSRMSLVIIEDKLVISP